MDKQDNEDILVVSYGSVLGMTYRFFFIGLVMLVALARGGDAFGAEGAQYRLGAGDKIQVTVFGHKDLSGEFEVDGSGVIRLPLVGAVRVGKKSIRELEKSIIRKLKPDYLKNPRVSVQVLNYRPFYIIGEVKKPGSYPYVNGMKVINAIALAGGFTYRARENRILVVRANDPSRRKSAADQNTTILPGDIIEVPERFF
jgi:polysaccharide export outer membrane protein